MMRAIWIAAACAACSGGAKGGTGGGGGGETAHVAPPDPCVAADAAIAAADAHTKAGRLYQALSEAGFAASTCDASRAAKALDRALAALEITPAALSGAKAVLSTGHGSALPAELALSTDGRSAATLSWNGSIVLWDATNGRELQRIETKQKNTWAFAADPELTLAASGDNDGHIRVWDLARGTMVSEWSLPIKSVGALAFHPDGKLVAAGGVGKTVWVYNVETGDLVRSGKVDAYVRDLRFTHDGKLVLVANDDNLVALDAESMTDAWKVVPGGQPLALGLSADGQRVAVGGRTKVVTVYDVASGKKVSTHGGYSGRIESLAVSNGGKHVIAAAGDTLTIWDGPGANAREIPGQSLAIAVSPDGDTLYMGDTRALMRFDVATGKARPGAATGGVSWLAFAPSGRRLAVAGENAITVWAVEKPIVVHTLPQRLTMHMVFDNSGLRLATGTARGTVVVWDLRTGKIERTVRAKVGAVAAVAISPDGATLAAGGEDGIDVWDTKSWRLIRHLAAKIGKRGGIAISPTGYLAATASNYDVKVWDAAGNVADELSVSVPTSVTFRSDGALVISGFYGHLSLRDVVAKKDIQIMSKSGSRFSMPTFARGDEWLIAATSRGDDRMIQFWNGHTGQPLRGVKVEGEWLNSIAISPDGTRLVAGRRDGTITIWDVGTGKVLAHAAANTDGNWAAVSADGDVDGSTGRDGGHTLVHWDIGGGARVPGSVRWKKRHQPGLLATALLSTDREAKTVSGTIARTGDPTYVQGEKPLSQRGTAGRTVEIRQQPDSSSKSVGVLFAGEPIVVIAGHPGGNDWLKIEHGDVIGWIPNVHARSIAVVTKLARARPAGGKGKPRLIPPGTVVVTAGRGTITFDGANWNVSPSSIASGHGALALGTVFEQARWLRDHGRAADVPAIVFKAVTKFPKQSLARLLVDEMAPEGTELSNKYRAHWPAHAVVVAQSANRASALNMLWQYYALGLPTHGRYPRLTKGDSIEGLKPGLWYVIAGLPKSAVVASELARYLAAAGHKGASVAKVKVEAGENLALLIIDESEGVSDVQDGPRQHLSLESWTLHGPGDELGRANVVRRGRTAIPYVPPAGQPSLDADFPAHLEPVLVYSGCGYDLGMRQAKQIQRGGVVHIKKAVYECFTGD